MEQNKHTIRLMVKELLFWLLFLVYTSLSFYLFYNQAYQTKGEFLSDMPSYIAGVQGTNERDPYPYRLFFWVTGLLAYIFPIELAAAFSTLVFNSLTVFILRYYIERYLASPAEGTAAGGRFGIYLPVVLTFSGLMASMVILPFDGIYKFSGQYYIGQGSGNVWHNATYLATRPFATMAFFLFLELLKEAKDKLKPGKLLLFSLSMFLTVFTKPTFAIVMVPAAAVMLIYTLITGRFKNIKNIMYIILAFIPAGLDALRQYFPVFAAGEGGIGFEAGRVWGMYTNSIPLSIALCFLFPLFIFCCNTRDTENKEIILFSSLFGAVALFEGVFLYEKGIRLPDGNFLQGYLHAMFYLFIAAQIIWFTEQRKRRKQWIYDLTALIFFLAHVVSGIWYFTGLVKGGSFY